MSFYLGGMWAAWYAQSGDPVDLALSMLWAVAGGIIVSQAQEDE